MFYPPIKVFGPCIRDKFICERGPGNIDQRCHSYNLLPTQARALLILDPYVLNLRFAIRPERAAKLVL